MKEKTFYDIHMHAFNLSHPYLLAFIQRLKIHQILVLNSLLGPVASLLIGQNLNKIKNMLAVMENDIGSFFLLMEEYLKRDSKTPLLIDGKLQIGGNVYSKIVLTPLMMDFGFKDINDNPNTYYNELSQKPIVEQVIDVFNGIKKYKNQSAGRVFEIYPFLGLNTKNYDMGRIERMLDKYFDSYESSREDLNNNMGEFDGNIEHLGSNFFAGIKVYPPLGFDPWPDNKEELEKVKY
ncbi:amidohydrolase, partial [bacterium]|nr:amidohydrolase [bacterium]